MSDAVLEGGGLRVRFSRQNDRYSHSIEALDCGAFVPLLESIEGTPEDAWPASPPLQSLHLEDRPHDRRVALLVGMAGKSHWSLSVELDAAAGRLTFDVACRAMPPVQFLGSGYRTSAGAALQPDGQGVWLRQRAAGLELRCEPLDGSPALRLEQQLGRLSLAATPLASQGAQTVRWIYCLRRE